MMMEMVGRTLLRLRRKVREKKVLYMVFIQRQLKEMKVCIHCLKALSNPSIHASPTHSHAQTHEKGRGEALVAPF